MTATLPAVSDPTTRKPRTDRQELSARLLGSAAKKSYDPAVDIDRTAPVPAGLYGLSPEWSTLYGTPMCASLSQDQRVTLTIHEYGSISGAGIWFEGLLRQLVLQEIYGENPVKRFDGTS